MFTITFSYLESCNIKVQTGVFGDLYATVCVRISMVKINTVSLAG